MSRSKNTPKIKRSPVVTPDVVVDQRGVHESGELFAQPDTQSLSPEFVGDDVEPLYPSDDPQIEGNGETAIEGEDPDAFEARPADGDEDPMNEGNRKAVNGNAANPVAPQDPPDESLTGLPVTGSAPKLVKRISLIQGAGVTPSAVIDCEPKPKVVLPPSVALPGCNIIYASPGQAGEYAPLTVNPYRGCGHGCSYCYVPAAIHMGRAEFDKGAVLRDNFIERLTKDALKYQAAGITDQCMLSFTSDPYHRNDTMPTREVLKILIEHGLAFCTLSKGGERALRDLDLFRPDRDAYAATLTTLDNDFSLKWERNAALPAERISTLKIFHNAGIFIWVSLEPTLNVEASLAVIEATHPYVDLYKVGKANYCGGKIEAIDWESYTHRIVDLMQRLGKKHYIKHDLQRYLPPNYYNPVRVPQHH